MGILRSGAKTTGPPTGRLVRDGRSRTSGARRVARLGHAMTSALPPAELLDGVVRVLEPAFRLDRLVAAAAEGVGYHASDRRLKRHVALHAHLAPDAPGRAWFLRETETLAALDHPTIRHVYAAAIAGRDRKSTRLNSSHVSESRMPSSA